MLKIAFVITQPALGGAQKNLLYILQGLSSHQDYRLILITSPRGELLKEFLNISNLKVYLIKELIRPISFWHDFIAFIRILNIFKKENPHLVHTHSSKAGVLGRWAAKLASTKIIIHTIHGFAFYQGQNTFVKRSYILIEALTAKITTRLIAVSKKIIEEGLRYKIGDRKKYVLIYYGISKEFFGYERKIRKDLYTSNGYFRVGMISCLKPQKAPWDFLYLAKHLLNINSNLIFLLIGDGPLRPKIERLIYKLNLQKKFILTGWIRDILQLLASLDLVVLTSYWEGLPLVILEAQAMGIPVVVTDVGGAREVVQDGVNGFLVSPGDIQGFSQKINLLLRDKDLYLSFKKAAKRLWNNQFEVSYMLDRVRSLYEGLINKGG